MAPVVTNQDSIGSRAMIPLLALMIPATRRKEYPYPLVYNIDNLYDLLHYVLIYNIHWQHWQQLLF